MKSSRHLPLIVISCAVNLSTAGVRAHDDHGPYFGVDAGPAVAKDTSLREFPDAPPGGDVEFSTGGRIGLNAGYRFNDWFSLGAETGFIVNEIKGADAALLQAPILAVVEFRLPNRSPIVPFIGGGPGVSFSVLGINDDSLNSGTAVDGAASDAVFAWQAYGGVRWNINDHLALGVTYKYFAAEAADWDVDESSQSVRFGRARVQSITGGITFTF